MALCFRLVLPDADGRLSIISCYLLPTSELTLSSASAFESHSGASDVLRELFKNIEVSMACQAELQSFS
jgi:hypothetical protein